MTITFTNTPIFTTAITGNEILISPIGGSGSTIASTAVNRLGYTTEFGSTATWQNPIWFRFYEPIQTSASLGTLRTFQTVDIETKFGATITAADVDKMLSMLFASYYSTPAGLKSDIQTAVPTITNIFERLNGDTPTNAWETIAPTINGSTQIKALAVFQDYGIGWKANQQIGYGADTTIGTIYKEVHVTSVDPLADPNAFPAKYRYLMNTEEQALSTAGNRKIGMLVYTNLFNAAFTPAGMVHYFQFLAIWPIIARILQQIQAFSTNYTPIAYINSLMDSTILQKGQGYFNRSTRINTTNGWFGNPIFSFANSFRLAGVTTPFNNTIIAPFIGYNEYLMMKIVEGSLASLQDVPFPASVPCIWAGEDVNGNISLNSAKAYVRLIMYYTACVERSGSTLAKNNTVTPTENNIKALYSLADIATYYQGCADLLAVGEYAHFFKYAQGVAYEGSTIFDTFIAPYISSWASAVAGVELLALGKYSANLATNLLPSITALTSYYNVSVGGTQTAMTAGEETTLTTYSYP